MLGVRVLDYRLFFNKAVKTLHTLEEVSLDNEKVVLSTMAFYHFWRAIYLDRVSKDGNRVRLVDYTDGVYRYKGFVSNMAEFKDGSPVILLRDVFVDGKVISSNGRRMVLPERKRKVAGHLWVKVSNLSFNGEDRKISLGDTLELHSKVQTYKGYSYSRKRVIPKFSLGRSYVSFSGYLGKEPYEYSNRGNLWIVSNSTGRVLLNSRHLYYNMGKEYFVDAMLSSFCEIDSIVDIMVELMSDKVIIGKRAKAREEIRRMSITLSYDYLEELIFGGMLND